MFSDPRCTCSLRWQIAQNTNGLCFEDGLVALEPEQVVKSFVAHVPSVVLAAVAGVCSDHAE